MTYGSWEFVRYAGGMLDDVIWRESSCWGISGWLDFLAFGKCYGRGALNRFETSTVLMLFWYLFGFEWWMVLGSGILMCCRFTWQSVKSFWDSISYLARGLFVVLGLRCLLDCHVLKGFGIYMIGILDRLYWSGEELSSGFARMFTR